MKEEIKSRWRSWVFSITVGTILIIVYKAVDSISYLSSFFTNFLSVIAPFLVGIFLAYLIYIPEKKIELRYKKSKKKFIRKKARFFGILTTYFIIILAIVILIKVIFPIIIESVNELISNVPSYYSTVLTAYYNLPDDSILKTEQVYNLLKEIQNFDIHEYFDSERIMSYVKGAVSVATGVFDVFVALVISIHVLAERNQILRFCKRLVKAIFKEEECKRIYEYFHKANNVFFKYISGQCLDVVIMIVVSIIALNIMQIKYASLLGFTIGLFNIIPYFGAILAIIVAGLITCCTMGFSKAIFMIIIITILQQIDSNIINPKIVGKYVEISPILVIIGVTVGGAYFGMIGMFLGVPVIAILKLLVDDYIDKRLKE